MPLQQVDARLMQEPVGGGPLVPLNRADFVGGKLIPEVYDEIIAAPPAQPTSVIFKYEGAVVATLAVTYVGRDVASVARV